MKLSDFNYTYPEELVAQRPLERRDESKMMFVNRASDSFEHSSVRDFPNYLNKGDLLVINDSKVLPVRLLGKRKSGGHIEILLLREIDAKDGIWECLATRKKRIKIGDKINFDQKLTAEVIKKDDASIVIRFQTRQNIYTLIEQIGLPPLPPYIKREHRNDYTEEDRKRYQTIYAKNVGSAAAPTAGFHLSQTILESCQNRGVNIAPITLHVGIDTFSPVRVDDIENHKMHGESFSISEETLQMIKKTKENGGRVVAVGTTTVRALESADVIGNDTNLFITPGYKFKLVDAMLTNFHQPKSTLIMMVSAFAEREFILKMYEEAIQNRYRLFSYGDCMLII
jgi:S-adenosylmethionine:tRNA ribosyltransferase-isomerase